MTTSVAGSPVQVTVGSGAMGGFGQSEGRPGVTGYYERACICEKKGKERDVVRAARKPIVSSTRANDVTRFPGINAYRAYRPIVASAVKAIECNSAAYRTDAGQEGEVIARSKVKRETKRFNAELETHLYALVRLLHVGSKAHPPVRDSRENIWRITQRLGPGTRFAGHPCGGRHLRSARPQFPEARGRHSVKCNRDAAAALAKYVSSATKCIVDRASTIDAAAADTGDALEALKSTSSPISSLSGDPAGAWPPWLFANREKEHFLRLGGALDKLIGLENPQHGRGCAREQRPDWRRPTVERLERSGTDLDPVTLI
ncbi:hypothetical protein B0H17DRAFT_1181767 [Mycena rosella]|uniref:Uncharacterized protein n=1 Tax=Mycena rosella TaxID=1033263 RepID=A0AAD7GEU4_MYCRO|nr:hypothetical protein B0H17DRAFT_1181767 [Mycena rosella]